MIVYPPRDVRPFVMYCVNGKPRSSLFIESTDSLIIILNFVLNDYFTKNYNSYNYKSTSDSFPLPLEAPSLSVLGAGIKDFLTIHFLHRSGMGFSWGDPSLRFSLGYFPIPFVEFNLLSSFLIKLFSDRDR